MPVIRIQILFSGKGEEKKPGGMKGHKFSFFECDVNKSVVV